MLEITWRLLADLLNCVFIAGASRGLGKELALEVVKKGANVVLLARSEHRLQDVKSATLAVRRSTQQSVDTITIDLSNSSQVEKLFGEYPQTPDILICVAGGTISELGFLADIDANRIKSCMENNYYSAAFCAQNCLKRWLREPSTTTTRHILFTSSIAAFLSIPGYDAYAPAKAAIRGLADTLRQELLLYGDGKAYQVHCCFPGTFMSEGLVEEQVLKPELTKMLEGSDKPIEELEKKELSAADVAKKTIAGLEKGEYFIVMDFVSDLLVNNMRGPSPRDRPVYDFILGLIAIVAWFFTRIDWDKKIVKYGKGQTQKGP